MIPQSYIFNESAQSMALVSAADAARASLMAFLVIGAGSAAAFVVLSQFLVPAFPSLPGWVVSAMCYAALVIPTYLLHRRYSFRSEAAHRRALPRYVTVQAIALLLAAAFSWVAYGYFGLPSLIAALLVVGLTSGINFVVLKTWAFTQQA